MADQKTTKRDLSSVPREAIKTFAESFDRYNPPNEAYRYIAPRAAKAIENAADYYRSAYSRYRGRRKKSSR